MPAYNSITPILPSMSASRWDWSPASADGLLTNEECFMLLDVDIFDDDLLKNFPTAATKIEPTTKYGADELTSSLYPPSPPELKPSQAELAGDLLHQIEASCKQENIFPNWLEEKVELPIFENIPQEHERVAVVPNLAAYAPAPLAPLAPVQQPPTEELLREFETVYGAVELTHLTPPQSPPGPATQLLLSYAQHAQGAPVAPLPAHAQLAVNVAPEPWALQQPHYDASYQEVDDIVAHRAAELASPAPSPRSYSISPRSSPPSSPRSSCTDEEWSAAGSSRGKPYARGPDDRRSRKKEQNKNAATRYRQKKKAEIEVLLSEESALRARHTELGEKCSDLQREIRYLKGLMRDLFKAKGLIK
ncbi:bZIP transcription factor domain-containing protein [Phthorimaea operculella]|nr:bZIP transcription factor domain-containing protein [Phthorimaea operculella]